MFLWENMEKLSVNYPSYHSLSGALFFIIIFFFFFPMESSGMLQQIDLKVLSENQTI